MGAGGVLRMVLDGEGRELFVAHTLDAVVVQVDVGQLHQLRIQTGHVHAEAMVLGGDFDLAGLEILDRLVAAAVAEFEFVGLAAIGQAEDLVAQADAEDRFFTQQFSDVFYHAFDAGRIAGAIGEKDAVWIHGQNFGGAGGGRDDLHPATPFGQQSGLVVLEAEIEGHHLVLARASGGEIAAVNRLVVCPSVRRLAGYLAHQIPPDEARRCLGFGHQGGGVEITGGDHPFLGPGCAQVFGQCPGINPLNAHDSVLSQKIGQSAGGAEVTGNGVVLFNDKGLGVDSPRIPCPPR